MFCLAVTHSCVFLFSFCAVCTFCRRYNSWCCGRHKTRCKYVSTFRSMWISTPSVSRYLSKATMVPTKEALDQIKIAASIGPWTILIKWHTQLHNHFHYRCKAGERGIILHEFLNGETLGNCSSPKHGQILQGLSFYIWHHSEISSPISVKIIRWLPLHIYNM